MPRGIVWRRLWTCLRWWSSGVFQVPRTLGFADTQRRKEHWANHRQDFGQRISVARYEAQADRFLTDPAGPTLRYCYRRSGWTVRYDEATGSFGVLSTDGIIRTYFKPIPCCWVPAAYIDPRWCHIHPDNLTYFIAECAK